MTASRTLFALAALILTPAASSGAFTQGAPPIAPSPHFDGTVSVLTYNIRGLPWPVADDRASALAGISDRFRAMRRTDTAPHIVALQEAFTSDARQVGREAGYRHVVEGPTVRDMAIVPISPADRLFASQAHWWKGETEGKLVGSGLQILSDYPVRRVKRIAYPDFACAGYDCLASKGALLVTIDMPGAPTPIDVVTTHLNSRHASGVSDSRSLYAYRRQLGILADAIRQWHDKRYPLIVSGDFNVGSEPDRRVALLGDARVGWGVGQANDALRQVAKADGSRLSHDARFALARARDWQFCARGLRAGLLPVGISVPFGHDGNGAMLSDHIGYVARFRLLGSPGVSLAGVTRNSPWSG
jgi:endonuclease/exonuclease/phosphatase family metal-dependent hydrolase